MADFPIIVKLVEWDGDLIGLDHRGALWKLVRAKWYDSSTDTHYASKTPGWHLVKDTGFYDLEEWCKRYKRE
jgi:hypothetical protein